MDIKKEIFTWENWGGLSKKQFIGDNVGWVIEFTNDRSSRKKAEKRLLEDENLKAKYIALLKEADKAVLGNVHNLVCMFSKEVLDTMHERHSPIFWWNFMDEIVNGKMVVDIDNEIVKYKGQTYRLYQKENFDVGNQK